MSNSIAMPRTTRLGELHARRQHDGRLGPGTLVAWRGARLPFPFAPLPTPLPSAAAVRAACATRELDVARLGAARRRRRSRRRRRPRWRGELRVVALALERIGQHVPRRAHPCDLVAVRLQLRLGDALALARRLEIARRAGGARRGSRRAMAPGSTPSSRSSCRSCCRNRSLSSASRLVDRDPVLRHRVAVADRDARSSRVSKSTVTHNGRARPRPGDGSGGRSIPPRRRRS